MKLRPQLEQVVREWKLLAELWDNEDRAAFVAAQNSPILFMSTTRVITLLRCTDVLRNLLEACE